MVALDPTEAFLQTSAEEPAGLHSELLLTSPNPNLYGQSWSWKQGDDLSLLFETW